MGRSPAAERICRRRLVPRSSHCWRDEYSGIVKCVFTPGDSILRISDSGTAAGAGRGTTATTSETKPSVVQSRARLLRFIQPPYYQGSNLPWVPIYLSIDYGGQDGTVTWDDCHDSN